MEKTWDAASGGFGRPARMLEPLERSVIVLDSVGSRSRRLFGGRPRQPRGAILSGSMEVSAVRSDLVASRTVGIQCGISDGGR